MTLSAFSEILCLFTYLNSTFKIFITFLRTYKPCKGHPSNKKLKYHKEVQTETALLTQRGTKTILFRAYTILVDMIFTAHKAMN